MAIVKADAYGHGLGEVVAALSDTVSWFGVANFREALRARAAAGRRDIKVLILSPATPEEIEPIVANDFSGSVSLLSEVTAYGSAAARLGKVAKLHAVADTGMGRMGCPPGEFAELVKAIRENPHCFLEGLNTHFPSADEDDEFTLTQIAEFSKLLDSIDPGDALIHLCNSAGLIRFSAKTTFASLARPGLALYGISPLPEAREQLRPVMSLKTKVTLVRKIAPGTSISYGRTYRADREMTVATLGVGYGDGYPRHLTGSGAEVLIAGQRCPLLGRVTMDQIVVDVSAIAREIIAGEEVVLIGHQGDSEITANELAQKAGTIPWEILTGITNRVERVHI
jgi:alanine racemase